MGNVARCFEDLDVYQRARELTNAVYSLTRDGPFARDRALTSQIRRACLSIVSNIAEGFERGTTAEFVQFLYIAKGSCGEVRAQLHVAHDQRYLSDRQYRTALDLARHTSSMLSNFIARLQRCDYRGEKLERPKRLARACDTAPTPEEPPQSQVHTVSPSYVHTPSDPEVGPVARRTLDEIRTLYPKAYDPWSPQDEAALAEAFHQGRSVEELAHEFGRQPNAIRSRLRKLGLVTSAAPPPSVEPGKPTTGHSP